MTRPLPSSRVPWLMILLLAACIVLVFMGFLRDRNRLLGPPLPVNLYTPYLAKPKPAAHAPRSAPRPSSPAAPAAGNR